MPNAYAIDFGTSNSLLAAAGPEKIYPPISLDSTNEDPTVLRSILYTPSRGDWLFGNEAINAYGKFLAEGRLLRSIKKYLPESSFEGTVIHGERFKLHELVAIFLGELRQRANATFQEDVKKVVLGRPAAFSLDPTKDKLAEDRLKAAALQAGFTHVEFCPEPIAAAYEFRHTLTKPQTVLIADFGGGTSDFTVLKMSQKPFEAGDVLSLGGISVAGDMFDGSLMKDLISPEFGLDIEYKRPMGNVVMKIPKHLKNKMCSPADISFLAQRDVQTLLKDVQKWSLQAEESVKMNRLFAVVEEHLGYKLFGEIEKVKKSLSSKERTQFVFDHYETHIEQSISEPEFQKASKRHVASIVECLDETVRNSGISHQEIDIVCCTGGTAKIPALNEELASRFGSQKLQQHRHFHSVIGGLAEYAKEVFGSS